MERKHAPLYTHLEIHPQLSVPGHDFISDKPKFILFFGGCDARRKGGVQC